MMPPPPPRGTPLHHNLQRSSLTTSPRPHQPPTGGNYHHQQILSSSQAPNLLPSRSAKSIGSGLRAGPVVFRTPPPPVRPTAQNLMSSLGRLRIKPLMKLQLPTAVRGAPPRGIQQQLGRHIARQQEKVTASPDYFDGWTPVLKKTP